MLDRFDGYPDPDRPRRPFCRDLLREGPDVMDASKARREESPLCGHIANDYDQTAARPDMEETR
jgi:hypothetical protein